MEVTVKNVECPRIFAEKGSLFSKACVKGVHTSVLDEPYVGHLINVVVINDPWFSFG